MSSRPSPGTTAANLRPVELDLQWAPYAEGSCLVRTGSTRVLCTASVEDDVPPWREESGGGWVTAEYAMLPRATHTRRSRERRRVGGRTKEIQRLIGRSLRAVVDLDALGPRTVIVDCDVLQADGGTRTAAVTGGGVALALAFRRLRAQGELPSDPMRQLVAAVSVGLLGGDLVLDLDYEADRSADVDMNVVGTEDGRLVEIQGTAEGAPFERDDLAALTELALGGIEELIERQRRALAQEEES